MEKTLKFIADNYHDIEVFESLKINEYFKASYVVAQNEIIEDVFIPIKPKLDNLIGTDMRLYYDSSSKTNSITY